MTSNAREELIKHHNNMIIAEVECIANHVGLGPLYRYVMMYNPAIDRPYHNTMHMITVAHNCAKLSIMEHNVDRRVVLAAALFHDFDHTGGHSGDWANIERAVAGFTQFVIDWPGTLDDVEIVKVIDCIRCTVFPFVIEPVTPDQKVLRDADLLQSVDLNFERILLDGLRAEMEIARGHSITRAQMAAGQMVFMEKLVLYTQSGKALFEAGSATLTHQFRGIASGS